MFNNINQGIFKADLWRLCILYKNSGVYADVDLVPHLNINTLDKNISFYSCIAVDFKSIFQAFMINFSKPNNPLLLIFLISYCINKPYTYENGPTYDMYNCIKYMLNTEIIYPEKKYEIDSLKLKINIGSSNNNIKIINLYYFPDNINYTINLHHNEYDDKFKFKIQNNDLIIQRTDKLMGWGQDLNAYLSIHIGNSETNTKVIKLDQIYPPDTELKFIHDFKDTFDYKFSNDELIITRTDEPCGWGQDLNAYLCIHIGSSETYNKVIKLDKIYPPKTELKFFHDFKDTFDYKFSNDELIITRTDEPGGWGHSHSIDLCFPYKSSFYFFPEKGGPDGNWVTSYVTNNGKKILDSRDLEYFRNKGW